MNAKQAENLRILADHMEGISRVLNMNSIFTGACGTPACALGEMMMVPHFHRLGVKITRPGVVSYRGADGANEFGIAAELLGVGTEDRLYLFGVGHQNKWKSKNVTGQEWASAAREILAKHGYPASVPVKQPERIENIDPALSALLKKLNVKEAA